MQQSQDILGEEKNNNLQKSSKNMQQSHRRTFWRKNNNLQKLASVQT